MHRAGAREQFLSGDSTLMMTSNCIAYGKDLDVSETEGPIRNVG
jgi:hypothetical protein